MPRLLEIALWGGAALAGAYAASVWLSPAGVNAAPVAAGDAAPVAIALPAAIPRAGVANGIVMRNPFRLDRRQAPLPHSTAPLAGMTTPPPPPPSLPKPQLRVNGILGGPPWEALLEGVPGREGSVLVRAGDTLDGLRIHRLTGDSVVVRGRDTTWTLGVKRQWP